MSFVEGEVFEEGGSAAFESSGELLDLPLPVLPVLLPGPYPGGLELRPLSAEELNPILQGHQLEVQGVTPANLLFRDLDLTREIKGSNFGPLHAVLQNPRLFQEMVSRRPPSGPGLFLFDGSCPDYQADGLAWQGGRRMNLKLIVYDAESDKYRIKSQRPASVVMRRQAWLGGCWRRHEYRLYRTETFYRHEDGQLHVRAVPSVQDFPLLVHYFTKGLAPGSDSSELDNGFEDPAFLAIPQLGPPASVPPPAPVPAPRPSIGLRSYAPDSGPAQEYTKLLVVVGPGAGPLGCVWDGRELEVSALSAEVVELRAPPHRPGVVPFLLYSKAEPARLTETAAFFYLPTDGRGLLQLERLPTEVDVDLFMSKYRHYVKELEVSGIGLTNLDFATGLQQVHSLNADRNRIAQHTAFPHLPSLAALSLRDNLISDPALLCDKLSSAFPNLRRLDLRGNSACPTAPHINYNYRVYILSRLARLETLDAAPVTNEERYHAATIKTE